MELEPPYCHVIKMKATISQTNKVNWFGLTKELLQCVFVNAVQSMFRAWIDAGTSGKMSFYKSPTDNRPVIQKISSSSFHLHSQLSSTVCTQKLLCWVLGDEVRTGAKHRKEIKHINYIREYFSKIHLWSLEKDNAEVVASNSPTVSTKYLSSNIRAA